MLNRGFLIAALLSLLPAQAGAVPVVPPSATTALTNNLASLQVTVQNVSRKGGNILMGLYDRKAYATDDNAAIKDVKVPATPGETVFVVKDIPPGTYAIKMMQDENGNGKFDQSWLGLPLEPYGFSNDARPVFSAPDFAATKFTLEPGSNKLTIHLQ